MKKFLSILLVLTLILGLGTACERNEPSTGENVEEDKVLVVRISGDPMSFNPNTQSDDYAYTIMQNIYNRLVKLDASKQIIPDLASSWNVSADGKAVTFHLKENVNWTDGESVTSEDVKYTFDTIKENPSYAFSSGLNNVDSIEIPDQYTVVFNLHKADVSFIASLGWYGTFVLPEHIFNTGQNWEDNPASKNPIGSGPFILDNHQYGENVVLVANENYHEGAPKINRLIFTIIPDDTTAVQALINGQIDVMESIPAANVDELQVNSDIRLKLNEYPSPMRIIFNYQAKEIQDINIRKAIATAINRDEISEKIFDGISPPEYNMLPSSLSWATNSIDTAPKFNIKEAIRILEDGGYEKDGDGYYVRGITVDVFEGWGYPDTAKLIEATLKQAGIELIVQVHEFNAWSEKVDINRNFILLMQGGFIGPDPAALEDRFETDAGGNTGAYSNRKFDQLLADGATEGDQDKRAQIYREAQTILAADVAYIPLVAYAVYDANNAKWINLPIDGAGKWGWAEYTFTDIR